MGHATCPSIPLPPPVAVVPLVHSFISQAAACCAPRISNAGALHPCYCLTKQACASDTLTQHVDHANASVHTALPQNEPGLRHSASCGKMARDLVSSNCISDCRLPLCVQIVGDSACRRIMSVLEAYAPHAIVVHRTVATYGWINFHTDTVARTVQVLFCHIPPNRPLCQTFPIL